MLHLNLSPTHLWGKSYDIFIKCCYIVCKIGTPHIFKILLTHHFGWSFRFFPHKK